MSSHEFAALLAELKALRASGVAGGASLATLVRTRGSAFRRAGARMLVRGDGSVLRGLSAGCPDADIAAHARQVIEVGTSRIVRYDREHGYDALLELGCGGELEILIEPLRSAADLAFADAVQRCLQRRCPGWLMSVYARDGQCLPRPRRLAWCDGVLLDELADPALAEALLARIAHDDTDPAARVWTIETTTGAVDVFAERLVPPLRLVVIGAGLISVSLTRLASTLGWETVAVDHRDEPWPVSFPDHVHRIHAESRHFRDRVAIDGRTAVVVLTHHLERDLDYLRTLPAGHAGYVGVLGSRGRAEKIRTALGADASALHSPAGLDIGSETPEEIALAIAAEIQAVFSRHAGGSLSESRGPIH